MNKTKKVVKSKAATMKTIRSLKKWIDQQDDPIDAIFTCFSVSALWIAETCGPKALTLFVKMALKRK